MAKVLKLGFGGFIYKDQENEKIEQDNLGRAEEGEARRDGERQRAEGEARPNAQRQRAEEVEARRDAERQRRESVRREAFKQMEAERKADDNREPNQYFNRAMDPLISELTKFSERLKTLRPDSRVYKLTSQGIGSRIKSIIDFCLDGKTIGGGETGRDPIEAAPSWLKNEENKKLM